jgi:hypothetical protein
LPSWDLLCKGLVKGYAQDFLDFFAPGAKFVGMWNAQLQTLVDGPFEPREMRADMVPKAMRGGKPMLMDTEWQSTKDLKIPGRLLFYSDELTRDSGWDVLSIAIYLQMVSDPPQPPLERFLPGDPLPQGNRTICFHYVSLEIYKKTVAELWELDLDAFTTLSVLCHDGGTRAHFDQVLERLLKYKTGEWRVGITVAFFFASKVLKSEEDQKFLERRREMIEDDLKDNWLYQNIAKEEREKGLEQGRVKEVQRNIEVLAEARFSDLLAFVTERIASLTDLTKLHEILILVGTARTTDEIKQSLLALQ